MQVPVIREDIELDPVDPPRLSVKIWETMTFGDEYLFDGYAKVIDYSAQSFAERGVFEGAPGRGS